MATTIPEFDDIDLAFPTKALSVLPRYASLTGEEQRGACEFSRRVERLFFSGGVVGNFFRPKPGTDMVKVSRFIKATLGDWGPKHEHKIGGIAHMLKQWCELA